MTTTNKSLNQPAYNAANWDVPLNANFGIIDAALGTLTYINVTGVGSTPVTLTDTQYQKMGIVFTGTPSANLTYNFPNGVGGSWIIADSTTGGSSYTITLGNLGGTGTLSVPRGNRSTVFSDGSSVIFSDDNRQAPPGSNTQVIYNSSGAFAASANFTFDGTNASVAGNISSTTGGLTAVTGLTLSAGFVYLPSNYGVVWGTSSVTAVTNSTVSISVGGLTKIDAITTGAIVYGNLSVSGGFISMDNAQPIAWGTTNIQASIGGDSIIVTNSVERFRFVAAGYNISRGSLVVDTGAILMSNSQGIAWGNTNLQASTSGDAIIVTNSTERFRFSSAGANYSRGSLYTDTGNLHLTSGYSLIWGNTYNTYITGVTASDITVFNNGNETARFFGTNNFSVGVTSMGGYGGSNAIAAAAGYLTQPGQYGGFGSAHVFNINWTGTFAELWIDSVNLGQIYTASDVRIKKNVETQKASALDRVAALRPVEYEIDDVSIFKSDGVVREGFIAQELQKVIPSAVNGEPDAVNKDGEIAPQSLNWAPIVSVAVKAIQELSAQVDELRAELAALKGAK